MPPLVNRETDASVSDFIEQIENQSKREDSQVLLELMQKVTGEPPKLWGKQFIIGFGKYAYTRKNSKEVLEWFHVGFAPRKSKLTIYLCFDITQEETLLKQLGKCKWGKGCFYLNKLADVDLNILAKIIEKSKTARWH